MLAIRFDCRLWQCTRLFNILLLLLLEKTFCSLAADKLKSFWWQPIDRDQIQEEIKALHDFHHFHGRFFRLFCDSFYSAASSDYCYSALYMVNNGIYQTFACTMTEIALKSSTHMVDVSDVFLSIDAIFCVNRTSQCSMTFDWSRQNKKILFWRGFCSFSLRTHGGQTWSSSQSSKNISNDPIVWLLPVSAIKCLMSKVFCLFFIPRSFDWSKIDFCIEIMCSLKPIRKTANEKTKTIIIGSLCGWLSGCQWPINDRLWMTSCQ